MNEDEAQLVSRTVDSNANVLEQILRIACYDEYRANAYYQKVIDTYGSVNPFVNIVEAEMRHIASLEALCQQYGVTPPVNDWYAKIQIGSSLFECCQDGVRAEIENIDMYDNLLIYVVNDDVREVFFREQAASYNNHLPAFSLCVENYQTQMNTNNVTSMQNQQANNPSQHHDIYNMVQGMMRGDVDINKITQTFSSLLSRDVMIGMAAGAALTMAVTSDSYKDVIGKMFNQDEKNNTDEKEKL